MGAVVVVVRFAFAQLPAISADRFPAFLEVIPKLSTWVFRHRDHIGEVRVREFVVPSRKRRQGGFDGLMTLASGEYELEQERVKRCSSEPKMEAELHENTR